SYQRLISIHPFMDANGRTARLGMDWILGRHGLPPAELASSEDNLAVFGAHEVVFPGNSASPEQAVRAVAAGVERSMSRGAKVPSGDTTQTLPVVPDEAAGKPSALSRLGGAASGANGGVMALAGFSQADQGVQEFGKGQYAKGTFDVASGTTNAAAGS